LSNLFSYIGKNSLAIMILHFTSFKLVNYLYLTANHLPTEWLSSFMTLHSNNNLWTAYVLVGIAIPIIINSIYRRIIQLFSARKKKAYSLAKI
jgi:fucose 4-O-acetylase-like acetyltransferase